MPKSKHDATRNRPASLRSKPSNIARAVCETPADWRRESAAQRSRESQIWVRPVPRESPRPARRWRPHTPETRTRRGGGWGFIFFFLLFFFFFLKREKKKIFWFLG